METIALHAQRVGLEQANRYTDELTKAFGQLAANRKWQHPTIASVKGIAVVKLGDTLFISGKQITELW